MFGTSLSSLINSFLSSQGQMTAVTTIISSAYGFICGGYIPISQMTEPIQNFISFLPGTYGTALIRKYMMRGVYQKLEVSSMPGDLIDQIRHVFDSQVEFMDNIVSTGQMYSIMLISIAVLVLLYVIFSSRKSNF